MPRKPKEIKRPRGVPPKQIDWILVDDYLETGCPGTKIADAIGVHPETLYNRCELEKGMVFSAYSQTKRNKGDALLFKAQFDKAIGRTDVGDSSILIHLGKTRLDQKEMAESKVSVEYQSKHDQLHNEIEEYRQSRQNIPPTKTEEAANEFGHD